MSRLQSLCQVTNCQKPVTNTTEIIKFYDGNEQNPQPWSGLLKFSCGHIFYDPHKSKEPQELRCLSYSSLDGRKTTRHYQVEGLQFIESSNFNCLIADQQGLGKTIEALLSLRENPAATLPALIIVKSATLWQWQREIKEWCWALPDGVWMIRDGKSWIPPGFKIYLMSMDTLRAFVRCTGEVTKVKSKWGTTSKLDFVVSDKLLSLRIKCVVADEVHSFKNTDSKRSQALVEFIRIAGIEKKIFLSGTPIKNRASEYFIPLNLLDPINFPSMESFSRRYLDSSQQKIDNYALDAFKRVTEPIVLRRERSQVLTDLPSFQRIFEDVVIENQTLKNLYNTEIEKIAAKDSTKQVTQADIAGNLMTMRRIIGRAKAELIIDFVNEFMEQTEEEKLCIGIHHKEVRDYLLIQLAEHRPLSLSGEDDSDRKQRLIDIFKRPDRRLMIVNIIAGGTGLNLQFCNNCVVLERQWNAADEEQFEDRFNRIGQNLPVTAMYPKAIKTIDQLFADMVEAKRAIFGETVALDFDSWMSAGGTRDLVDWMMGQGKL